MEDIHNRIKQLRMDNGFTLKDLSEKTDFSVSFLSQVERGASSLAITSLKRIADAFGVPMSYFFEDQMQPTYHVKTEQQRWFRLENSETMFVRVGGNFPTRLLEPMLITLAPNQKRETSFAHPGEEFYYVIRGNVLFEVDGEEYLVREGDCIHFPSTIVHDYENLLDQESMMLCVLTPVVF